MKQVLVEFFPFVLLLTLTLCVHFVDIKPFQQGFFCGDHTLKYPYIEKQTIPGKEYQFRYVFLEKE